MNVLKQLFKFSIVCSLSLAASDQSNYQSLMPKLLESLGKNLKKIKKEGDKFDALRALKDEPSFNTLFFDEKNIKNTISTIQKRYKKYYCTVEIAITINTSAADAWIKEDMKKNPCWYQEIFVELSSHECSSCIAAFQKLLHCGINLDETNRAGFSPLVTACRAGSYAMANLLINAKANIEIKNTSPKLTPLLAAILQRHNDIAGLLLDNKANVDGCMKDKATALLVAVETIHDEKSIELLLRHKANPNAQALDGVSPFSKAEENKDRHPAVYKLLLQAASEWSPKE